MRRGIAFGVWTLLGVFFASQTYISYAYTGRPTSWRLALTLALSE